MATDIDVPFLPSAAQIRRREFASVRRGYDPDQVRDYLAQVAEQVEMLEQEAREAKLQPGAGPRAGGPPIATPMRRRPRDPYERLSKRLTTLLATADKEAEAHPRGGARGRGAGCSTRPARTRTASVSTRRRAPRRPASRGTSCWSARSRRPTACCSASPSAGRRWSSISRTCRPVWSGSRRSSRSPSRIPSCRRRPSPRRPTSRKAAEPKPVVEAVAAAEARSRDGGAGRRRTRRPRRTGEHARRRRARHAGDPTARARFRRRLRRLRSSTGRSSAPPR